MNKTSQVITGIGALTILFASGCTPGGPDRVELTGDVPTVGTSKPDPGGGTRLVVYTPKYLDLNLGDSEEGTQELYTGYTVYDEQGRKLEYVRNWAGRHEGPPSGISLAPGKYLILLEDPEGRSPLVRVNLEKGKLTEVDVKSLTKAR